MNRRFVFVALLFGGVFFPHVASANAGTPLMWATMFHLAFGNLLIGLGEGLLLARVFKLPRNRCVGWMVVANYFSAWLGMWTLRGLASKLDWNICSAWRLFWLFVLGAYVFTVLLEWPLVVLCFWKRENWLQGSVTASVLAQTLSYLLLFGWYWGASVKTLYTQMKIVPASELHLPANLKLFYISATSGQICEGTQVVGKATSSDGNERLLFVANPDQANTWSLQLLSSTAVVIPCVSGSIASDEARPNSLPGRNTWMNFGSALRLDTTKSNKWEFSSGFWAAQGLRGKNRETGETFRFAWETPFANWIVRNVIQLPDERVVFQLGYDQICLLDPESKRIALLARGRGPAVLLE